MIQHSNIEIKYKKALPVFLFLCSVFIFYVSSVAGFSLNTITGVILLILSMLMLTRPVVIITSNNIQMMNLLGITVKNYPYIPEQILIQDKSIYVDGKKVISSLWLDVNLKEVKEFFLMIEQQ
ncbi:hypothetical protein NIES4101_78810 [Calothrix sp. NIES-4101]|nr:hypothetical protein NIES4101_78810 [Calothrix sp. NIES-4101]